MKRLFIALFAVLVLCLSLTGCVGKAAVPIDSITIWEVTSVQNKANGAIVACSEEMSAANPDAKVIEMICAAKDGKIAINCSTTDEVAEGYYAATDSGESTVYALRFDMFDAAGVTAFTTYDDGTQVATLIIDTGDYVLNFVAS